MELDVRTLIFSLGAIYILQAITFLGLSVFIVSYRGIKYWAIGGISIALGFFSVSLRNIFSFDSFLILLSNMFIVGGLIFTFIGSKKFLGVARGHAFLWIYFSVYLLVIFYFTGFSDRLNARIIVFSLATIPLFFLNGWIYLKYRIPNIRHSALSVASLFFMLSLFFAFRLAHHATGHHIDSMFSAATVQLFTYFFSLGLGILWTFAIIVMVNQRLNDELVQKTKELEQLNADKDKFFSILSHDLRGALASVAGISDIMADANYDFSKQQITELSKSINKTALSTNELLENLLEWSGLQRGLKSFNPRKFLFGELMVESLKNFHLSAQNKNITLQNEIPESAEIVADPYMFQAILRNLVSNAIKFTPEGGTIRLSVQNNEKGEQEFSVSDNGIGMNSSILNSLFTMDEKNKRPGTKGELTYGLGLLLCKEFVEKHGGIIRAESTEGKGSSFLFTLSP